MSCMPSPRHIRPVRPQSSVISMLISYDVASPQVARSHQQRCRFSNVRFVSFRDICCRTALPLEAEFRPHETVKPQCKSVLTFVRVLPSENEMGGNRAKGRQRRNGCAPMFSVAFCIQPMICFSSAFVPIETVRRFLGGGLSMPAVSQPAAVGAAAPSPRHHRAPHHRIRRGHARGIV
jgi:hypothetical protein